MGVNWIRIALMLRSPTEKKEKTDIEDDLKILCCIIPMSESHRFWCIEFCKKYNLP